MNRATIHCLPLLYPFKMMSKTLLALAAAQAVSAHYGLIYPPWRVDTLDLPEDSEYSQWTYPCTSDLPSPTQRANPMLIDIPPRRRRPLRRG